MKSKALTSALYVLALLGFGLCLYLYLMPVLMKGIAVFYPRNLSLDKAKDYYAILSAWITFLVGVSGLILGYFYYTHRLKTDMRLADVSQKRKRLDDLVALIDAYDNIVDTVIHYRFKDENELRQLRYRMERSFETIIIMLEQSSKLLGLGDDDVKTILRVNAFVDKNDDLMHKPFFSLTKEALLSTRDTYINLIQDARRCCFTKVC